MNCILSDALRFAPNYSFVTIIERVTAAQQKPYIHTGTPSEVAAYFKKLDGKMPVTLVVHF